MYVWMTSLVFHVKLNTNKYCYVFILMELEFLLELAGCSVVQELYKASPTVRVVPFLEQTEFASGCDVYVSHELHLLALFFSFPKASISKSHKPTSIYRNIQCPSSLSVPSCLMQLASFCFYLTLFFNVSPTLCPSFLLAPLLKKIFIQKICRIKNLLKSREEWYSALSQGHHEEFENVLLFASYTAHTEYIFFSS